MNSCIFNMNVFALPEYMSQYYAVSVFVSLIAIIATTWVHFRIREHKQSQKIDNTCQSEAIGNIDECGVQAQFKLARQKLIQEPLTPWDLQKEKIVESQALQAIDEIIKQRDDMFPPLTMEELQKQLRLYKVQ